MQYGPSIRPTGEISKEEAEELAKQYAFYEARYDRVGKLMLLRKHYQGKVVWEIKYFYDPNSVVRKCEDIDPSDLNTGMTEHYFDSSGNFIKFRKFDSNGQLIEEYISPRNKLGR